MLLEHAQKKVSLVIDALANEREKQGISKRQLALKAGVDPKTVGLIERGERNPTLLTLLVLSLALDVDLSQILQKSLSDEQ